MWHAVTLQLSNSPELLSMLQETKMSIHHQHKPRQMHLEFTYSMTKFKSTHGASILATSVSLRSRPCLFWTCSSSKFPAKQDLLACVGVIAGKCRDSICLNWIFSTEFLRTKTGMERHSKSHVKLSLFTRDRKAKLQCLGQWSKTDPIIQIWLDYFELPILKAMKMKNLMLPDNLCKPFPAFSRKW